ncbi:uncharacterized protein [Nerophis lumbriciformis]|uniref:uncharacterized protein isoform X2 n=1 Tax=Nerophis lumbriciformis TaxID=546530 RepID=UPI002ADFBCC2|nr:uncharacterized protein wu:fi75a02 isoform X2 [Nerophis lumbriciformis]
MSSFAGSVGIFPRRCRGASQRSRDEAIKLASPLLQAGVVMAAVTPPPALPLADGDDAGVAQTSAPTATADMCHRPCPRCPCSTLLPRLLAAHRMEMRRLLRGALMSLGRRLDALERRSGRRPRKRSRPTEEGGGGGGATKYPPHGSDNTSSLCSPAPLTSSSLDPVLCWKSSQSGEEEEEEEGRDRKRRKKSHRRRGAVEEREEDAGRFVGRMVLCRPGGGAKEDVPLTLVNFNQRQEGGGQSGKAMKDVARRNGCSDTFSHNAFHFLHLSGVSSQWRFSDFTPAPSHGSNHRTPRPSSLVFASFGPAPLLHLSVVVVAAAAGVLVMGGTCWNPWRCLRDWTAPPSLSTDHCYGRPSADLSRRHTKRRVNRGAWSRLRLAPPSSAPPPADQSASSAREREKRVSQIPIRRAPPRETHLTPMGLPKVQRVKKKDFSVEEIYTNKNYKSPSNNRSLETIFEEPREKDGALLLIGQQRRRRLLLFPDFTQPRKRKRPQGAGLPAAFTPRKRTGARRQYGAVEGADESDVDVMLVERLSALEDFLTRQGLDM